MGAIRILAAAGAVLTVVAGGPAVAGDAAAGKAAYKARCTGCHSIDANKVGPLHRGVIGRTAGTVAGYGYSRPLQASGLVWTEDLVARWLSGPQAMVPGSYMRFTVADPAERADIAAYLATQN